MRNQSVGVVKTKNYRLDEKIQLKSGKEFGPIDIAYETYGELNKEKTNAILVCHALSGNAHAAGKHKKTKEIGWWDKIIGPGKALDTEKYYIISSNVLGGCDGTTGPSSKNPKTNEPYGLDFPIITIEDMVKVQKKLITKKFGIKKLLSVVGGSMGGMQALKWAKKYPEFVKYCIPIATTSKSSPQQIAFNEVGRRAIMTDPNWNNGNYYKKDKKPRNGLALARMIGHITYLSDQSMQKKFGRELNNKKEPSFDLKTDFEVESYLNYKGNKFVQEFDPNTYLYLTKAIDYFDLTQGGEKELREVFKNLKTKFLIISVSSDWLYPPYQSKEIVKALEANNEEVTYSEIKSSYGHDAFLLEKGQLKHIINSYLSKITVNDIAEKNPPTIKKTASIKKAAKKITTTEQTHLPVTNEKKELKGIITAWDISKAIAQEQKTLEQIMTKKVVTAKKQQPITEITEKLRKNKISALPVVNEENKVMGLITSDQISQLIRKNQIHLK